MAKRRCGDASVATGSKTSCRQSEPVKILMDKFSRKWLQRIFPRLLEEGPTALLPQETLDQVANACIKDNVLLASGTSVLAGLPGGITMAVTIPTDVAQFYAFSLKLA